MNLQISVIVVAGLMAAFMIGGSYLIEKWDDAESLIDVTNAQNRNPTAKWNRQVDENYSTTPNSYSQDTLSELERQNSSFVAVNVTDPVAWSIGKVLVKSLQSGLNHRFAQVLRAMGLSLVIGIVSGICTCFLGPLFWFLCLHCLGFEGRGVAAGSIAASMQSWMGNVEAGSCFSRYQSLGSTGLTSVQPIVVVSFVVGALSAIISLIVLCSSLSAKNL